MNDAPRPGDLPDEDPQLGRPVTEIADLELKPAPGFLAHVRRRIERRFLTGQLFDLSWFAPVIVVLEYLDLLFSWITGKKPSSGEAKK